MITITITTAIAMVARIIKDAAELGALKDAAELGVYVGRCQRGLWCRVVIDGSGQGERERLRPTSQGVR